MDTQYNTMLDAMQKVRLFGPECAPADQTAKADKGLEINRAQLAQTGTETGEDRTV